MHRPAHPGSLARWADDLARAAAGAGLDSADVLAGLAAELGVGWDGPGRPVALPVARASVGLGGGVGARRRPPGAPGGDRPGRSPPPRRPPHAGRGRPPPRRHRPRRRVAGIDGPVVDPSCGGGAFLLAAGEALVAAGVAADAAALVGAGLLRGADIDPVAVATARAALEAWSGVAPPPGAVVVADALEEQWFPPAARRRRRREPAVPLAPHRRSPDPPLPARRSATYTDASARFLAAAVGLCRPGGRVVLVQPESLLAARDAAPVRAAVLEAAALEGLWVAGEPVFAAGARVCAPVLRVGAAQPRSIRRWRGDVRPAPPARVDLPGGRRAAPSRPGTPRTAHRGRS